MSSDTIFGLLIVAVEGLISVEPDFVAMGPDDSNIYDWSSQCHGWWT
jgi:hypothetical protein